MQATDTIRARIDGEIKAKATAALARMGLSVSDAIRLLMHRVAEEECLPFDVRVPNAESRKAMADLETAKGKRFASPDALFDDLGI
jgi:DNA-damage-inducible protein J